MEKNGKIIGFITSLLSPCIDGGKVLASLCATVVFIAITLLFLMIIIFALPVFIGSDQSNPFNWVWLPTQQQFGVLPMLVSSVVIAFLALLMAYPLAIAIVCWMLAIGKGRLLWLLTSVLRFMTAIPTIVYAFIAVFLLTPIMRQMFGGSGLSLLSASMMLSILILPTIVLVLMAGLQPKLAKLFPSGLTLGFSRLELLWIFVLPQSKKTLVCAAMLGIGRAIGDTLLPLMLAGNATQTPHTLLDSVRTLTAHMVLVTANEVGGGAYNSLFVAGFLLLVISLMISLTVKQLVCQQSVSKPMQSMVYWGGQKQRKFLKFFNFFCYATVFFIMGIVALWIGYLIYRGIGSLSVSLFFGQTPIWEAMTGRLPVWDGIWPALIGTLSLIVLTLSLAVIPSIGCGIFLAEYASPRVKNWGTTIIDVLAGMPSIVMGLFGFLMILFLRHIFDQANTSLLLAASCLALLVLPVMILTTKESLEAIPQSLRLTASSLGIDRSKCIYHFFLPVASKGILGGIILAVGRAAEDTAVIMLTGAVANSGLPAGLTSKFEALPFHIFVTASEYQSRAELDRGFSTALVLLLLSTLILLCVSWLEKTYRWNWRGGVRLT